MKTTEKYDGRALCRGCGALVGGLTPHRCLYARITDALAEALPPEEDRIARWLAGTLMADELEAVLRIGAKVAKATRKKGGGR